MTTEKMLSPRTIWHFASVRLSLVPRQIGKMQIASRELSVWTGTGGSFKRIRRGVRP